MRKRRDDWIGAQSELNPRGRPCLGPSSSLMQSSSSSLSSGSSNTWNQVASLANSGAPVTPVTYDAKGNPTAYGSWTFEFDAFNRLGESRDGSLRLQAIDDSRPFDLSIR